MSHLYVVPHWFFGFDIAMELVFAIIALILAIFTYKVYRASEEREVKLFGISFSLISLSYFVWAWMNYYILHEATEKIMDISVMRLLSINYIGTLIHMILFTLGILTLAYSTLDFKSGRTYYIIAGLSLVALVSSSLPWITYQILVIFLLSAIVYHYALDHSCYKNKKARLTFIAFLLLTLSRIDFLFTLRSGTAYIIGHILELSAYVLILLGIVHTIKGCKK